MPDTEKTRQHLINLHNSNEVTVEKLKNVGFKNGEIAVQHGTDEATSAIHILNNEQTKVVTFVPKGQDDNYLGKTAKAADSELLDGNDSTHFATAEGLTNLTARVTASEGQIVENSKVSAAGIAQNKTAIDANTASIEANASEISGLDTRLTATEGEIDALQTKKMVDSFGGVTGDVTLKAEDSANGSINLKMSGNELQANIIGLGSAAYTESTKYIQGVTADNTYLSASDDTDAQHRKISANVATKEELENGTPNKLTSATVVKDYVEGKVSADKLDTVTISGKVTGTGTRSGNSLEINATAVTLESSDIPDLDASKITTGKISIERIPAAAVETVKVVANRDARLALKKEEIQKGDTVKEQDTKKMYFVVDDTKLSSDEGYEEYVVGIAAKADEATKLSTARTITIGSTGKTFDGQENVSWTLEEIGLGNVDNTADSAKNVATAKKLVDSSSNGLNIGNGTNPIYFSDGVPVASTSTVGDANHVMYLSNGVLTKGDALPNIPSITIEGNDDTTGMVVASAKSSNHTITLTEQAVVYNDTPVNFANMTIDCGEY